MPYSIIFLILLILILVVGWHIIFAVLGGAIIIGAGVWAMLVTGTVFFCIAILVAFFLTGFAGILLSLIFAIWTIIAIAIFPILFPILLPLFIIYAFISYHKRKKNRKKIEN